MNWFRGVPQDSHSFHAITGPEHIVACVHQDPARQLTYLIFIINDENGSPWVKLRRMLRGCAYSQVRSRDIFHHPGAARAG
jgi:hypothetical protein